MKIRGYDKENEDIKLEMTPMIDIVFQLLVFFIMTYKVTAMEGDYNIRMPSVSDVQEMQPETLDDFVQVKLTSNADRFLESISVSYGVEQKVFQRSVMPNLDAKPNDPQNLRARGVFQSLNDFVINVVGSGNRDPGAALEVEAEIEADFNLRYSDTVARHRSLVRLQR